MFELTVKAATMSELKESLLVASQSIGAASPTKPAAVRGTTAAAASAPKVETPALDYKKDVGPLILKLADKSRPKAVELLGQFGVAKGTDLKPAQFAEFVAAANAAIESAEEDLG